MGMNTPRIIGNVTMIIKHLYLYRYQYAIVPRYYFKRTWSNRDMKMFIQRIQTTALSKERWDDVEEMKWTQPKTQQRRKMKKLHRVLLTSIIVIQWLHNNAGRLQISQQPQQPTKNHHPINATCSYKWVAIEEQLCIDYLYKKTHVATVILRSQRVAVAFTS